MLRRLGLTSGGEAADGELARALWRFLLESKAPFEQTLFDWYGGQASAARASQGPNAVFYASEAFAPLGAALQGFEPSAPERLDHAYFGRPAPCTMLIDEVDVALAVTGCIAFEAERRERISIHPLVPIRFVRSSGLFYPMDGLLLEPGGLIGTSNEGVGSRAEVEPEDETPWLLILRKERLWDLVKAIEPGAD